MGTDVTLGVDRVWHYVKGARRARMPRRHIFLDTEAHIDRTSTGHVQRWRLGVAAFRSAEKNRTVKQSVGVYDSARQLWRDVESFTRGRNRTVLWAHNLGYDVRISESFDVLPALGWRCTAHNLASRGTWVNWRKGDATLLMVDSCSVFPVPLDQLAKTFLSAKVPLPSNEDSRDRWVARCTRDVEILGGAVTAYLDWLEAEDLGSWQLTGAGQSYAAFRHRFLTHQMMVHGDVEALAAERRAMWTGRCEAYWRGRTGHVGVEEWDLSLAYARIARDNNVPCQLVGEPAPDSNLGELLSHTRFAFLADVEVETSRPLVPCRVDGRMAWPVGRFSTTLWGPELALALECGASVRPSRIWAYAARPALRSWAAWIIDALTGEGSTITPWQRIVLKHWVRALIGRFGMRYSAWEHFGVTKGLRIMHADVYDVVTGEEYTMEQLGQDFFRSTGEVEWDQSQPAVTGYVMSVMRVWLWHLMQSMPDRSVLYADTDSFFVTSEHHDQAVALAASELGDGLRLKSLYKRATILGPRQIVVDGRPRMAGVPTSAVSLPGGRMQGEVWSSLSASMRRGRPSSVITTDRVWKVSGVDHRRMPGPDGWTVPYTVEGGVKVD